MSGKQFTARRSRYTANRLRYAVLGLLFAALVPGTATALQVRDCDEIGIGIDNISSEALSFYEGQAKAYLVDTVEPAAAPVGLAIVVPTPESESPVGGNTCWAIIGYSSIDLAGAKRSYDPVKGLLLEMQNQVMDDTGSAQPGPPLKLRINLGQGRVALE